ncbi:MAG: hypothetical protein QW350_04745 [Candidatus Aenigmatarchaeota archaeon]|nr:hypothetical protein [Candidatus Aenigmarchaeota archaeon]
MPDRAYTHWSNELSKNPQPGGTLESQQPRGYQPGGTLESQQPRGYQPGGTLESQQNHQTNQSPYTAHPPIC